MSDLPGYDDYKTRAPDDEMPERECGSCEASDSELALAVEKIGNLQDALEEATNQRDALIEALDLARFSLEGRCSENTWRIIEAALAKGRGES